MSALEKTGCLSHKQVIQCTSGNGYQSISFVHLGYDHGLKQSKRSIKTWWPLDEYLFFLSLNLDVKYFNGMNKTLRTIRKLVKLWDIDDLHLDEDLAELQRKFGPIPEVSGGKQTDNGCKVHCCGPHHLYSLLYFIG